MSIVRDLLSARQAVISTDLIILNFQVKPGTEVYLHPIRVSS